MAGRYWSNFTSFVGNTPTLDFDSLAGTAGSQDRTEQVRYTSGPLSVALEDPSQGGILQQPNAVVDAPQRTGLPAISAKLEDSSGALSYAFAVLANQITADNGDFDESVIGFATFAAANIQLTDMSKIQGAVNFTDGANGYLWRSGNNYFGPSAYRDGNDLETIEGYGGSIGVTMELGDGQSINLGYGFTTLDLDDAVAAQGATDDSAETNQNVMLNYMVRPIQNLMVGVEYGYFDQETVGGESSDANRLIFAAQYNF